VQQIDHANGIKDDDRLANLREATQQQNLLNRRKPNRHGVRGVKHHAECRTKPWEARITLNGTGKALGMFATKAQASAAYEAAAAKLHGRFAASKRRAEPKRYVSFLDCRLGVQLAEMSLAEAGQ
jgi:hypothetical protein